MVTSCMITVNNTLFKQTFFFSVCLLAVYVNSTSRKDLFEYRLQCSVTRSTHVLSSVKLWSDKIFILLIKIHVSSSSLSIVSSCSLNYNAKNLKKKTLKKTSNKYLIWEVTIAARWI